MEKYMTKLFAHKHKKYIKVSSTHEVILHKKSNVNWNYTELSDRQKFDKIFYFMQSVRVLEKRELSCLTGGTIISVTGGTEILKLQMHVLCDRVTTLRLDLTVNFSHL